MPEQTRDNVEVPESNSETSGTDALREEAYAGFSDVKPGQTAQGVDDKFGQPDFFDSQETAKMGYVGEHVQDTGCVAMEKPEVRLNSDGNIMSYTLPNGQMFEIDYTQDQNGNPKPLRVIFPEDGGRHINYVEGAKHKWMDMDNIQAKQRQPEVGVIDGVRMGEDGSITIITSEFVTLDDRRLHPKRLYVINKDGSFVEKDITFTDGKQKEYNRFDADGTGHVFDYDKNTERVYKPGSHVCEVKRIGESKPWGYEVKDDHGHVTNVDLVGTSGALVTRGEKGKTYDNFEHASNGDLLFSNKDKSTLVIRADGTSVARDGQGRVTEIINSDGETTAFKRGAGKSVSEVTVTDGQGNVVESIKKGVTVDDTNATYTVAKDKDQKVERASDGTERLLDKENNQVESDADKLVHKFTRYTPEEVRQLRQDLADIDRLPKEQKEAIYKSLWKIADNDLTSDRIRLTGRESRELVSSLAHQIAHPESIRQGSKMTCAVASAEQSIARNHPEMYADMVSKLATEGEYTTASGRVLRTQGYDKAKLAPKSDFYGQRSHSSELFQNAAVQLALKENEEYVSYGPFDYAHFNTRPKGLDASKDLGERVIDRSTEPPTISEFPGLDAEQQVKMLNGLVPGDKYSASAPVDSPQALGAAVKENGGLPMSVGIHLGSEAEFSGMNPKDPAAATGYHEIQITHIEYDKQGNPTKVYYENTAGGTDHSYPYGTAISASELVAAMQGGNVKMQALTRQKPKAS